MEFISEALDRYVSEHTEREPELLQQLSRETYAKVLQPRMLSGAYQGRILSLFSKLIQPHYILEIGTYTGYSALCLCEGLQKDGLLHTIDINEELYDMQRRYFDASPYGPQTVQHTGDAQDIIPNLELVWDLVFIDADKAHYPQYFELIVPCMRKGGIILADNVLWSGKVLEKPEDEDEDTKALVAYNRMLGEDPRVEVVIFPIRDGLSVCRVV